MAYITIPQLPAGTTLTGLEQFESVQAGTSVRLTAAQLKTFTSSAPDLIINDTNTNGVSIAAVFGHTVTGTPATGIGVGVTFDTETSNGSVVTGSSITSFTTDNTATQEDFVMTFSVMNNGALAEKIRITNDGFLGVNTTTPFAAVDATINDANNSATSAAVAATHVVASPNVGIGTSIQFRTSTSGIAITNSARISAISTDITPTVESFDLVFDTTIAGSTNQEVARLTSTRRLGVGTSTPTTTFEAQLTDASTNSILSVARLSRASSGVPAIGIGTALEFATETAASIFKVGAAIYTISTALLSGSEDFDLGLSTMGSGVLTEVVRITSTDRVGINTTAPSTTLHVVTNDSSTNTVLSVSRLTRATSGTPAIGIGTGIEFETEAQSGTNRIGSLIQSVATAVGVGAENFDLVFRTMTSGATASEKFRIGSAVISPSLPFDFFGAGIAPSVSSYINVQTNSATVAPLRFSTSSPQLLTTATPGVIDFNNQSLYFTPQGIERGVLSSQMTYINTAGSRAGPNATTAAQSVTVTAGSPTLSATTVPGSAVGNTGCLAIFSAVAAPTGITLGQPYWVNFLTSSTFTVSATQGGTPIAPSTTGTTVTVIFYFPILGNGTSSVGLRLGANTRYMYELHFTVSHTAAAATSVAYALTNITGTLSAHYYRVNSQNSTTAFSTNLTGLAATSSNFISNFITSGFSTFVTVTGVTAATANTTNILQIQGQIDTLTDCTYVMPVIGFPVAPTATTIFQGAYMSIYPVGPVVSNTSVGSWET